MIASFAVPFVECGNDGARELDRLDKHRMRLLISRCISFMADLPCSSSLDYGEDERSLELINLGLSEFISSQNCDCGSNWRSGFARGMH